MEEDVSVGAVVFRNKSKVEFLILKRADNNLWEFPKGHIKEGESEIDTLNREMVEELGISDFVILPNFKEVVSYNSSRGVLRKFIYYLLDSKDEIQISSEHSELKWIQLHDASNYFEYDDMIDILKKVIGVLNEV